MISVRILRHIIDSFSLDFPLGPSNLVDSCRTVRKHCDTNCARRGVIADEFCGILALFLVIMYNKRI